MGNDNIEQEKKIEEGKNIDYILSILPRMPNSVMEQFYIEKINNSLKSAQPKIIETYNIIKEDEENKNEIEKLNNLIQSIIIVENNKWEKLSEKNLLSEIKDFFINISKNEKYLKLDTLFSDITSYIKPYIEVDNNIKITEGDNLFSLYKYIHPEEKREEVLFEIYDLYEDMF